MSSLAVPRIDEYGQFFASLSDDGFLPYDYQLRVAEAMWRRENVVLRAPTGAGKTIAVLAPFLYSREAVGVARVIYALPLRTLAQGIYQESRQLCGRLGKALRVTLQTGEQPDDPFFTLGDIVVTTYDQVLSGLLCGPYGLPDKLRNINGAAAAGNLIVFDEFHLMETSRAFLTAAVSLKLFGKTARSVWMTATATKPLTDLLKRELPAVDVGLSETELAALPSVALVLRRVRKELGQLSAEAVLAYPDARTVVIVNRVTRAQALGSRLTALARERGIRVPVDVLHARFFGPDRKAKQARLETGFGPRSNSPAILITTQVVEAGINISCDHLHTEICPMNALVQRAGRCARFPRESGTVHVYNSDPSAALPYDRAELDTAWALLPDAPVELDPTTAARWVDSAHRAKDELTLQRYKPKTRYQECQERIWNNVVGQNRGGVADLIREQSDSIRVAVIDDPRGRTPSELEGISLYRYQLRRLIALGSIWVFDADGGWIATSEFSEIDRSYAAAVPRSLARYTPEFGLELGVAGDYQSPTRCPPSRPGYRPLRRESWVHHTKCVMVEARRRLDNEGILLESLDASLSELLDWSTALHDLGKLQSQWQEWAEAAQRARDPLYRHTELLAHTDFDSSSASDRALSRTIRPPRPHHSAASAYYGSRVMEIAEPSIPFAARAACISAVLGHHGGWAEQTVLQMHFNWESDLRAVRPGVGLAALPPPSAAALERLWAGLSSMKLQFATWWPLAAYLTRTLRLSDQLATEEGSHDG
jgi:CRISPR-associated endonuclease/helicase Cas3